MLGSWVRAPAGSLRSLGASRGFFFQNFLGEKFIPHDATQRCGKPQRDQGEGLTEVRPSSFKTFWARSSSRTTQRRDAGSPSGITEKPRRKPGLLLSQLSGREVHPARRNAEMREAPAGSGRSAGGSQDFFISRLSGQNFPRCSRWGPIARPAAQRRTSRVRIKLQNEVLVENLFVDKRYRNANWKLPCEHAQRRLSQFPVRR